MTLIDFMDVPQDRNFYFQFSLRPFKVGYSHKHHEWMFFDLDNREVYSLDELEREGLYFYNDEHVGEMAVRLEDGE